MLAVVDCKIQDNCFFGSVNQAEHCAESMACKGLPGLASTKTHAFNLSTGETDGWLSGVCWQPA